MKKTPLRPGPPRRAWIRRRTKPKPSPGGTPRTRTPIKKVNRERQAKRRAAYQKALRSPHTKALRKQVYHEQGGLCVCRQEPMTVLDHIHYQRLGHELREDVQGLGPVCNARETTGKRANWMNGRRGR
jgi:hypothetical protein